MDPERWRLIEELYHSVLERAPNQRSTFLAESCQGDNELRRQVEVLLLQSDATDDLVGRPVWEVVAGMTGTSGGLTSGTRLGPYEIVGLLGEGGMAKVYRALDTRLDRAVAVKVSSERLSARFEREARTISALNHPQICTLYDVGPNYLVMELVEGETLAQRVGRAGPLPLEEVLDIGLQVAEALEAAHCKGIVHRDVKPSNVQITAEGRVKVLDFGLAKTIPAEPTANDGSSPTAMTSGSAASQIPGTLGYMSPEQAGGKEVDRRTDIWAFGCLLYELMTGQRAFSGEGKPGAAATLERGPNWQALPPGTPRRIRDLLRTCLEKDAQRRPPDMKEVRACIEDAARGGAAKRWQVGMLVAVTVVLLAGAGLTAWVLGGRAGFREAELLRPVPLTSYPGTQNGPSFSPDGTQVAFSWDGEKQDNLDIYIKRIGSGPPLRVTRDPARDISPAWSPDGNSIAFLREVRSKISFNIVLVPSLGGRERILGEVAWAPSSAPGQTLAWSADSKWLASYDRPRGQAGGLWLISVETGERHRLTTAATTGQAADDGPAFSPGGRSLAFIRRVGGNESDLYLLPLGKDLKPRGEPRRLTRENQEMLQPFWTADGRELIYSSGPGAQGELWRLALRLGARPRRLTAQTQVMGLAYSGPSNRLVFSQSRREMDIYRVELGAHGGEAHGAMPLIASSRQERYPRYAPDGKKVAFISLRSGKWQLWVCDSDGTNVVQLTSFGRGEVRPPTWSEDGREIEFKSNSEGAFSYYAIGAAGGIPRKLEGSAVPRHPRLSNAQVAESLDGRFLFFGRDGSMWRAPSQGGLDLARILFDFDGILPESGLALDRWGVYFVAKASAEKPGEMMFYRFPNGPVSKVIGVDNPSFYGSSVSPDGRYLLYTKFTATGSDLMLVENFR